MSEYYKSNKRQWATIKDYPNYLISTLGEVFSMIQFKNLKQFFNRVNCYPEVMLRNKEGNKKFYVHRLVAEAFIENPENKPCVDHINGRRTDNRVSNLRWVSQKENCNTESAKEAYKNRYNGLGRINQYSVNGDFIRPWDTIKQASEYLGIDSACITEATRGKQKTAGGFKWERVGKPSLFVIKLTEDNIPIEIYDSAAEASRKTKLSVNSILSCCKGATNSCGGYIWKYYDDYKKENKIKNQSRQLEFDFN